jgi:hypothetical protein
MGNPAIDAAEAAGYFQEAAEMFAADDGALWGVNLQGPIMFVDPATRQVVTNWPDAEGQLTRQGTVHTGSIPAGLPIADTSVDWAGVTWAMVIWPPAEEDFDRKAVLAHESWHRIQETLGFPSTGADNEHLDSLDGRIWLQLEWRALAAGLQFQGAAHRVAMQDALLFRAHRRALFPSAAANERRMEMHEGLAEYSGIKLASGDLEIAKAHVARTLRQRPKDLETFGPAFPYLIGPAYGLLLDETRPGWRKEVAPGDDLGEMLAESIGFSTSRDTRTSAIARADRYDGQRLIAAENRRETERLARQARFQRMFMEGPVVEVPLLRMRMTFDQSTITPFGEFGTVYGTIRLTDVWGELSATQGCLVGKSWDRAVIALAESDIVKSGDAPPTEGPGWALKLEDGWEIVPDEARTGSFVVREKQ